MIRRSRPTRPKPGPPPGPPSGAEPAGAGLGEYMGDSAFRAAPASLIRVGRSPKGVGHPSVRSQIRTS